MSKSKRLNLDRRRFLQATAATGALAFAQLNLSGCEKDEPQKPDEFPKQERGKPVEAQVDPKTGEVTINPDVAIRYSACLGCYSSCGNSVRIDKTTGKMFGVGGNPYNPNNAYPYINFDEPLTRAYQTLSYAPGNQNHRSSLCGRGNASFDGYTQPDRITMPLKRAGKRGEGKWKPITWEQLIDELYEGGKLFADIGEDREIEGFKAVRDTENLIDPEAPEFGTKSNQLVSLGGRGDGRTQVGGRFLNAFGSVNFYGHGST